jgi:hypothetical protein
VTGGDHIDKKRILQASATIDVIHETIAIPHTEIVAD